MKKHIGVKLINAKQMTLAEFTDSTGIILSTSYADSENGYLVEYTDGGKANHPDFAGYISWSPKEVFENAYRPVDGLSFGLAVEALKLGKKVARAGWNGKGMFVRFVPSTEYLNQHFELKNVAGTFDTWVPSISDALAEDWQIVEQ